MSLALALKTAMVFSFLGFDLGKNYLDSLF
jgi:hypothetical protein